MQTDVLKNLNDLQRKAAEHIEGPLLIVAGPGSGKTRVITHRIAYLVETCGLSPRRIAAVTFTNKAAREMRLRLSGLLGQRAEHLTAATFHSFCAMVLRRDGERIGLGSDFAIYDDADQIALLKRAMTETGVDPKNFGVRAIQSAISGAKSQLIDSFGFADKRDSYFDEIVHRVFERYDALLVQAMAVDFDDILLRTHRLLDKFPDVAEKYQQRYLHFLVDEFQDTNVAQYTIARQMAAGHNNLCVVGDPDQSIYSWRNAARLPGRNRDHPRSELQVHKDDPERRPEGDKARLACRGQEALDREREGAARRRGGGIRRGGGGAEGPSGGTGAHPQRGASARGHSRHVQGQRPITRAGRGVR